MSIIIHIIYFNDAIYMRAKNIETRYLLYLMLSTYRLLHAKEQNSWRFGVDAKKQLKRLLFNPLG